MGLDEVMRTRQLDAKATGVSYKPLNLPHKRSPNSGTSLGFVYGNRAEARLWGLVFQQNIDSERREPDGRPVNPCYDDMQGWNSLALTQSARNVCRRLRWKSQPPRRGGWKQPPGSFSVASRIVPLMRASS